MRRTAGPALVLGYGNELRGDDGAGYELARRLTDDPRLLDDPRLAGTRVVALRQLTPELALDISRAGRVVFVDASRLLSPGEVGRAPVEPAMTSEPLYSHQLTPSTLLGFAAELYGAVPQAVAVSIGIGGTDFGDGLSTEVAAALPRAADEVVRLVGGADDA